MKALLVLIALASFAAVPLAHARPIVVASKGFTESYILGEIAAQTIENQTGLSVERKLGMGSTGILFEALTHGHIDVYADYTGTLVKAILKNPELTTIESIQEALDLQGLSISESLGFNNTYALAVKTEYAKKHQLTRTSDLAKIQPKIRSAFSYEFMDRADGFSGMMKAYGFQWPIPPKRMEHSLAYQAIDDDAVDLIEIYSTDAKIEKLKLQVLADDLNYFPQYLAVFVVRKDFVTDYPKAWEALRSLENSLSPILMTRLNAQVDLDKQSFSQVASQFLNHPRLVSPQSRSWKKFFRRTQEHLLLVGIALLFSMLAGIPLGIFAAKTRAAGQLVLLLSGVVQTIPSLALLCFLIPWFGVGIQPALVALCLYGLLPVVLNTFVGIRSIPNKHHETAQAMGMSSLEVLTRITLPLASPSILAGVKTATIVSIGTATLAALIGAGGYGAPIVTGLALNDIPTILEGAIPAAGLALLAHGLFVGLEHLIVSPGLKK